MKNARLFRIQHAYFSGKFIEFNHPEELADIPNVTGIYTSSGGGYCPSCAEFIGPSDITHYETADCSMIICENCGKAT